MKKKHSLWMTLSLLFVGILILIVSISYGFVLYQNTQTMQREERQLLQATGNVLADDQEVIQALNNNHTTTHLQKRMHQFEKAFHFDFIVIMDMNSIRLTHPDATRIGEHFQGGDETLAIHGKPSFSTSKGTMGESLRYFEPVFKEQTQVGLIAIGIKSTTLSSLAKKARNNYTVSILLSSLIGLFSAFLVAFYLKRQLHNLEPGEAYRLLEERNAMLEETKDAVFVINLAEEILLTNRSALLLVGQKPSWSPTTNKLADFIPSIHYLNFQRKEEQLFRYQHTDYLVSISPILVNHQKNGYILFFRQASDTAFAIDQLANTTAYASALQSQSHEFMNKLHIIYGLVDLAAYDELQIYLQSILKPDADFIHQVTLLIKDPVLASFFIGEREKFAERKTQFLLDIRSEIALFLTKHQRQNLLNLYRFIDLQLLQLHLPDKLTVVMDYQANHLETIYSFESVHQDQLFFQSLFHDHYFQQLLIDLPAIFTIHQKNHTITFHIHY